MKKINITKIGIFATPQSQDALMNWMESLAPQERVVAITAYGMTWNFLADKINESQKDDNQN